MKKTTKEDFQTFTGECDRLVPLLGFACWDISYAHEELKNGDADAIAMCEADYEDRTCTILFNKNNHSKRYQDPVNLAKHEMAHLLLAGLAHMATNRFISQDQINIEEEKVCTVLEKLL